MFATFLLAALFLSSFFLPQAEAAARIGVLTFPSGENGYGSQAVGPAIDSGYLYCARFGDKKIARIRTSDLTWQGTNTLSENPTSLVSAGDGYVYVGTWTGDANGYAGGVVRKIRSSDFGVVATLTFSGGPGYLWSAVIGGGYAYFGGGWTDASCKIGRIRLSDFTVQGTINTLSAGNHWGGAVIDTSGGYAYFATDAYPTKVVRIRLSDFTWQGTLTLSSGGGCRGASTAPYGGFIYFVNDSGIHKVSLSSFTEQGSPLTPAGGVNTGGELCVDTSRGFMYHANGNPGVLSKIRLSDFTVVEQITFASGEPGGGTATDGTYLYNVCDASPSKVVKVDLTKVQVTFQINGVGSDASGSILTIAGTGYSYSQLPQTFAWTEGSSHTITANSPVNAGSGKQYAFTSWSDGGAQSHTYTVPSVAATVTANYKTQYQLTISVSPSGRGSTNPAAGSYWYDTGSSVPVTATPASGYAFDYWVLDGNNVGSSNPYSVTMNGAHSLEAKFKVATVTITFQLSGVGSDASGTILTIDEAGYSYSAFPKSFTWTIGSTHSVAASTPISAGSGKQYVFTSWTNGDGLGGASGTYTTPSSSATVTANFKTQYYLTVSPAQDSPNPTSGWFDSGTSITASVSSPVSGGLGTQYVCTGWTGTGSVPASGSGTSTTFTINAPSSITWNWKTQYQLTMAVNPSGTGSSSPTVGSHWYDSGQTVSISATPASGYTFSSWTGNGAGSYSGSSNPASITMNAPIAETANFQVATVVSITITSSPVGSKFIKVDGFIIATPHTFSWLIGSSHTLEALSPQSGGSGIQYVWASWSDGGVQTHSYTVPSSSQTVTANYKTQYLLVVDTDPAGLSPQPSANPPEPSWYYDAGTSVTLTATRTISGFGSTFNFTRWKVDGTGMADDQNSISVTMNFPHTAVACYQGPTSPPSESESTSQIAFSMYDPIVAYGLAIAASALCLILGKLRKGRNRER